MIFKVQGNVNRGRFSLLPYFYMIFKVQGNVTRGRFSLLPSFYMIFKVQGNVTRGRFSLLPSFYMIHKVQEKVIRGRFSLLPSFYMIQKILFEVQNLPSFSNFLTYSCVFNVSQECHYCHLDLVVIEITGLSPRSRKDSKVLG
jgi:hypothetical protein